MEFFNIVFWSVIFSLNSNAGYIDPGSASAVIAMIIGVIAGAGMTIKLYWFKIKLKLFRKGSN
jgi:hypothetical protein|tara:strand:- start:222 stop:410 length:189 start_codon:yes stop_codon:yes gene_type:complete